MKLVEIVTHCQSIQRDWYSSLLTYQLSSLVLYPPKNVDVCVTVCCCSEDKLTKGVLDFFWNNTDLKLDAIVLSPGELGRRAIGRNVAAKKTKADIVWFTDCDYIFHEGCLDSVGFIEWNSVDVLLYAKEIQISVSHTDPLLNLQRLKGNPKLVDINKERFRYFFVKKAIGGLFLVEGNFAREEGYCPNGHTPQKPTDGTFISCICDRFYRWECLKLGNILAVDIPSIYRIRHPKRIDT